MAADELRRGIGARTERSSDRATFPVGDSEPFTV
jgi:hypothetical protein